jgi:hypothetical protein
MTYDGIISVLSVPEVNEHAHDGISHSLPIPGFYCNKIVDCFFLYSKSLPDKETANAPFSVIVVDTEAKSLVEHHEEAPHEISTSLSCLDEEYWEAYSDYEVLYPQVRSFAFSESVSPMQKETLRKYLNTLGLLVNTEFYMIYRKLFADFFIWAEKTLKGFTNINLSKRV